MTNPVYQPAAVLDIASFGFRKLFSSLWQLTKLTSPFIIAVSVIMGLFYPTMIKLRSYGESSTIVEPDFTMILMILWGAILIFFILMYLMYVIFRYTLDVYQDKVLINLYDYWLPEKKFLGLIGLSLIFMVASLPAAIILVIGFILFVIPGIVIMCALIFVGIRVCMSWYAYMIKPEEGLFEAIAKSWKLTAGNFWRTFALTFLIWLIQTVITMPFSLITSINDIIAELNPSYTDSIFFVIIMTSLFIVAYWAQFVFATGGAFFVNYRYYFDLESRTVHKGLHLDNPQPRDLLSD